MLDDTEIVLLLAAWSFISDKDADEDEDDNVGMAECEV